MKNIQDVPAHIAGSIGELFQQLTKYHSGRHIDLPRKSRLKKPLLEVTLPPPRMADGPPIWDVILRRRSRRAYADEPLRKEEISQLLWACQGVTAVEYGYSLRAAPSAGALYPINTYVLVNAVTDMNPGLYLYEPESHKLQLLREGAIGRLVAEAALGQDMATSAGAVFAWTAVVERSRRKYSQRCYRYIYMDAGHIGQNLSLAAEALGLGCCCIGALYDEEVNEILMVDGVEETIVYMASVGKL